MKNFYLKLFTLFMIGGWCSLQAFEIADHRCEVVMRYAGFSSSIGWTGFSFTVDVRENFLLSHASSKVRILYNLNDQGWKFLDASKEEEADFDSEYTRFNVSFQHSGHRSMWLNVVALVEYGDERLFDHNFEVGDIGNIELNRENNWTVLLNDCE